MQSNNFKKPKKKFKLKNKIALVLYILFFIYYSFCWYQTRITYSGKERQEEYLETYSICEEYQKSTEQQKQELIKNNEQIYNIDDTCTEMLSHEAKAHSTYSIFKDFFENENLIFPLFVPIIVTLPFIYTLSKEFKSKLIKSYLLRDTYKNYKKHIFKEAYKNIFFIPIVLLITFIISYFLSGFNLNPSADIAYGTPLPNLILLDNPILILIYIITLFIGIGLFINIALIVLSKNKNFITALLESELLTFMVWAFTTIVISSIGNSIFKINVDNFNILNIYFWDGINNVYLYFLLNLALFIISLIIAILSYRNKEKIVTLCEK